MAELLKNEDAALFAAFSESALFRGVNLMGCGAFLGVFRRGEVISAVQNGVPCVGILASGRAEVYTRGDAMRQNVSTLLPGSAFGICNVFLPREMPTELLPKVRCTVAFLPKDAFVSLLECDSALMRRYLALCNEKILYLADKVELMGVSGATARFAAYLLRTADCTGLATLDISKEQLAKYLSVSRASLFRAIGELSDARLISPVPGGFRILNRTEIVSKAGISARKEKI